MANESTATTLAGLMERVQAPSIAQFAIGSRLVPATLQVAMPNADVVQFPALPAVSPVTSGTTDGSTITHSATTISSKTVSPIQVADAALVSTRALMGGTSVSDRTFARIVNNVVAGADYLIASQFTGLTAATSPSAVASITAFRAIHTQLEDAGFGGQAVAAFSHPQWSLILASLSGYGAVTVNEQYTQSGKVFTLEGVDVFPCPSGILVTDTTKVGAIWFREFGIGFGYHAGSAVSEIVVGLGAPAPLVHLSAVEVDAAQSKLSALVLCEATEMAALAGVYHKFALS